jgi:hypothetical protein
VVGKKIQTKCAVYAGLQKQQEKNLQRLPAGTVGTIKNYEVTSDNIQVYLVKFLVDGKRYFAKLGPTTFEVMQ